MYFDYKYNVLYNVWSPHAPEEGRKGRNVDESAHCPVKSCTIDPSYKDAEKHLAGAEAVQS